MRTQLQGKYVSPMAMTLTGKHCEIGDHISFDEKYSQLLDSLANKADRRRCKYYEV